MSPSVTSLVDFPPRVLENILWFLPQELLLQLALTNFHFYEPCSRKLYRKITIQVAPTLKNTLAITERRRLDFIDLSTTVIGGFNSRPMPRQGHVKLVVAKLKTLINSIDVNPQLAQYIEVIQVHDDFQGESAQVLRELFQSLSSIANSVVKIYIADYGLRKSLRFLQWQACFNLKTVVIDDFADLSPETLARFPNLDELIIADASGSAGLDPAIIPALKKLRHVRIRDHPTVYDPVIEKLTDLHEKTAFVMENLQTFNVVHTHDNHTQELPFLNTRKLVNFQISLGCDDYLECDQECLHASVSRFEFHALKRLAIIQNSSARHNTHKNTEKWDLVVFSFVKEVLETCADLSYLSIRHNVPLDGLIEDGYEGNYLRKVKLYTLVLPRLLSSAQRHVVNLILPNFVASLACYEQPMNTFLWNGCKCKHCAVYLEKLDDYLLHHRYYSTSKQVFKDLQTVQMVRTMSEVLSDRVASDSTLGDLSCLDMAMKNTSWDFHANKFSIPFRCLPVKTYDINDMEDDAEEAREDKVRFFDAEDKPNDCIFLRKERFYPDYLIVISHFLDDLIRKMINLNRGDAEDTQIGQINDENDGWTNLQINKMLVNGIDYNFDHEINGTIFYTNSYDDAE